MPTPAPKGSSKPGAAAADFRFLDRLRPDQMIRFATNRDPAVVAAVAAHPELPPEAALVFAAHPDPAVVAAVAARPELSPEIQRTIAAGDHAEAKRVMIRTHPKTLEPDVFSAVIDEVGDRSLAIEVDAEGFLLANSSDPDMRALAQSRKEPL